MDCCGALGVLGGGVMLGSRDLGAMNAPPQYCLGSLLCSGHSEAELHGQHLLLKQVSVEPTVVIPMIKKKKRKQPDFPGNGMVGKHQHRELHPREKQSPAPSRQADTCRGHGHSLSLPDLRGRSQ